MVLLPLILLAVWWRGALRIGRSGHVWCAALLALGSLGFFGPLLLASTGDLLNHVELPALLRHESDRGTRLDHGHGVHALRANPEIRP